MADGEGIFGFGVIDLEGEREQRVASAKQVKRCGKSAVLAVERAMEAKANLMVLGGGSVDPEFQFRNAKSNLVEALKQLENAERNCDVNLSDTQSWWDDAVDSIDRQRQGAAIREIGRGVNELKRDLRFQ